MMPLDRIAALKLERHMLSALAAAAPRGRPEVLARLKVITAELLRAEVGPESQKSRKPEIQTARPADAPPDRTRWWDK